MTASDWKETALRHARERRYFSAQGPGVSDKGGNRSQRFFLDLQIKPGRRFSRYLRIGHKRLIGFARDLLDVWPAGKKQSDKDGESLDAPEHDGGHLSFKIHVCAPTRMFKMPKTDTTPPPNEFVANPSGIMRWRAELDGITVRQVFNGVWVEASHGEYRVAFTLSSAQAHHLANLLSAATEPAE